jgi:hypothetical protein
MSSFDLFVQEGLGCKVFEEQGMGVNVEQSRNIWVCHCRDSI